MTLGEKSEKSSQRRKVQPHRRLREPGLHLLEKIAAKMIRPQFLPRRLRDALAETFQRVPVVRERERRDVALDFEVIEKLVGESVGGHAASVL